MASKKKRWLLIATAAAILVTVLAVKTFQAREISQETVCRNNLRQLVLAILNYESAYSALPVGIKTDDEGRPYQSWRTQVYPMFLVSAPELYNPDYAWDAPENFRLVDGTLIEVNDKGGNNRRSVRLDPCPQGVWGCPADHEVRVNYGVVIGEETAFPPNRPAKLDQFSDGLSETILLVEILAGSSYWTEPKDLTFEEMTFELNGENNGGLASFHRSGIKVAFADGEVFTITNSITPSELKALFTIAGGEAVKRQDLIDRGVIR